MISADRVALGMGLVILALPLVFWLQAVLATGDPNYSFLGESLLLAGRTELIVALPAWAFLRAIDALSGGPARRKTEREEKAKKTKKDDAKGRKPAPAKH